MAVNDFIEVKFWCTRINQVGLSIRHWQISAETGGGVTLVEIAKAIRDVYAIHYPALLHVSATFHGCSARKVAPAPPSAETAIQGPAVPGQIAGEALPPQIAGLISLRTPLQGRANRGRMYLPFPGEDSSGTNGRPNVPYLASLALMSADLDDTETIVGAGGTATLLPQVYHRLTMTGTLITAANGAPAWATQRRRGDFGRPNQLPGG